MPEYIDAYIHNSKIGVLVHFSCEDDYSVRTKEFKDMARDIAMHIAATKPLVVEPSDLDPSIRNKELSFYEKSLEGISEEEKLNRFEEANRQINSQFCLLCQPFIKEPEITAGEVIERVSKELKDKVALKRFIRWAVS